MVTVRRGQYTSTPGKAILALESRRFRSNTRPDWLVVSAWPPELRYLRRNLSTLPTALRRTVALGSIGVGLVEAGIGASRLLAAVGPRAVILVGTAGIYPGAAADFALGTALVADEIALVPEILPGRHAYLPEIVPSRERPTPKLTAALREAGALASASVANPLAITATRKAASFAVQRSRCVLENLEAFALARAAASAKLPYAVVLGVANQVGPSAHVEWTRNAAAAAAAACEAVLALLRAQPPRGATRARSRGR